jgi:two-component system NtrC family sensor kinase
MNCWEFKKCGREAGGTKVAEFGICPAYPDNGADCAQLAGTFCGGQVQGYFAQKLTSCINCDFYNSPHHKKDMKSLLRLVTVVDQTAEAIIVTDVDGAIVYVNPAFARLTGYSQIEMMGKNPRILKSGEQDSTFYRSLWKTLQSCGVWQGRITDRRKDGTFIEFESTITAVRDHLGNLASYVAISRDVTEIVKLETQLRQAQKLEAVGSLASGIAHEINTPLQFVGDNVRFLSDSFGSLLQVLRAVATLLNEAESSVRNSDSYQDYVGATKSSDLAFLEQEIPRAIEQTLQGVERVTTIVRAMKEFSHPDGSEKTPTDINRALETTLTVAGYELRFVADVKTDFDRSLPLVHCHPGPLNQVFLNLLVNAVHAIADVVGNGGKEKGTISIRTFRDGDAVVVAIGDTAAGIKPEIRDRIFDPFFTTKGVGKGTGQGLAIARSVVVDKHGGSLTFETEEGKGTTFYVRLPLQQEENVLV